MESPPKILKKEQNSVNHRVADLELDLRGTQCPMNFVYTKVKLEELEPGQILHIILDFAAAFTSVPNSIKRQNLGKILREEEIAEIKEIWIQKSETTTKKG